MHELCGRYGIPREEIWDCTLGEFDALCSGAASRERTQRLDLMSLVSIVISFAGGKKVSPQELIGEEPPPRTDNEMLSSHEIYQEFKRQAAVTAERRRKRWHRRWAPPALCSDEQEPTR